MKVTLTDEQIEKAAKAANAAACTSNPDVDVEEMWEVLPRTTKVNGAVPPAPPLRR